MKYLEKIEDPYTYKFISKIKLKKGSNCLELDAGRGFVAKHLCNIVGQTGFVHAVDIDTRFLNRYPLSQLIIIEKNIEEIEFHPIIKNFVQLKANHTSRRESFYPEFLDFYYLSSRFRRVILFIRFKHYLRTVSSNSIVVKYICIKF